MNDHVARNVDRESTTPALQADVAAVLGSETEGRTGRPTFPQIADRVKGLISQCGLSLYEISKRTRFTPFDDAHSWFIPDTFYQSLRRGQPPHVCQIVALSRITGIGLYRWLKVFGHDLENIPRLQSRIHEERTIILLTRVFDDDTTVLLPTQVHQEADLARSELVPEISRIERIRLSQCGKASDRYLYLRVGLYDTRLVPKVVPGTVVRVDRTDTGPKKRPKNGSTNQRSIFAVAHVGGLTISYVDWIDTDRIVLFSRYQCHPACAYRVGEEALVLGRVDAELRPLGGRIEHLTRHGHDHSPARLSDPEDESAGVGRFLRANRERIGLTYREAQALTQQVAHLMQDPAYAIALGSLSDWEANDTLPSHVPQLISICAVYCLDPYALLRAAGVWSESRALQSVADCAPSFDQMSRAGHFLEWATMVVRLRHALPKLTGEGRFTWEDVLWWGSGESPVDMDLDGARFVFVNRRDRRLGRASSQLALHRPIFLFRTPSLGCVCGQCFVEGDFIYLQPSPQSHLPVRQLSRRDVEVVGKATAVMRVFPQ